MLAAVFSPPTIAAMFVVPAGTTEIIPVTSQSPAVNDTVARSTYEAVVRPVNAPVEVTNSPTLPAFALSFVVVPTMPFVLDGVNAPELLSVVKAPVLAAVLPIGPGDAKRFTNPVPLTVDEAESVVKAPVFAAVLPIGGGDAKNVVNPAPLTVELAESVVNAPVFAAVLPIGGGEARNVVNPAPLTVELAESVVKAPVDGVVLPTAVLLMPPVALKPPVCAQAPVPLVDVIPLMPATCPPVIARAFVKPVKASLAKPKAKTVEPHVMNAFLLLALRTESINWTVGFGLL